MPNALLMPPLRAPLKPALRTPTLSKGVGDGQLLRTVPLSVSGQQFPGPCSLSKVTCLSGNAASLVLYDSSFSATGTVIFTDSSMDAGDVTTYSPYYEALNGIYAVVTASAGPELVTNGTFPTNTTGWTAQLSGTSLAVNSARLELTAGGSGGRATQTISGLTIGHDYLFTGDFVSITPGGGGTTASFRLTTDTAGSSSGEIWSQTGLSTPTSVSKQFTAATTSITVAMSSGAGGVALFDNISMKEVYAAPSFELELAA